MCEPQKINQKSAEAQTKAEATPQLQKTIKYLEERQTNLSRYSDKLSSALYAIANAIDDLNLSSDLYFIDTEPFCTREKDEFTTEKGYLQIYKGSLITHYVSQNSGYPDYEKTEDWIFNSIPRRERNAIIASGRLPIFLGAVAKQMQQTTEEYRKVAEAAEKMAASITEASEVSQLFSEITNQTQR